jgi:hypothetical protein
VSASPACKAIEQAPVAPAPPTVEVRRGCSDADEPDVHVEPVTDADDVAEQAPVGVDTIGGRLGQKADDRTRRQKALRRRRCLPPVALRMEVDLRGIDLDEAHALPVAQRDGVAISHVVDAGKGACLPARVTARCRKADCPRADEGGENEGASLHVVVVRREAPPRAFRKRCRRGRGRVRGFGASPPDRARCCA